MEHEEIVDSYPIGIATKRQIKDLLRSIKGSDSRWINVHLFIAAYRLLRGFEYSNKEELARGLEASYDSISHICKGRDRERVKRSILRYYFYIRSLKGHGLA